MRFFSACEKHFRFLETDYEFRYLSGLCEYKNGRYIISPYQNDDHIGERYPVTRYEKDRIAFEIIYDGRIEAWIYYDRVDRLSLEDVFHIMKKFFPLPEPSAPVEDIVRFISDALRAHIKILAESDFRTIKKTILARNKILEAQIRKHHRQGMQDACIHAAQAFLERNYKRTIELLTPFETDLPDSDLKKLQLAREYLLA